MSNSAPTEVWVISNKALTVLCATREDAIQWLSAAGMATPSLWIEPIRTPVWTYRKEGHREEVNPRVQQLQAELDRINKAIAVKGGTEHYPTEWAYLQACKALENRTEANAKKDHALRECVQLLEQIKQANMIVNPTWPADERPITSATIEGVLDIAREAQKYPLPITPQQGTDGGIVVQGGQNV